MLLKKLWNKPFSFDLLSSRSVNSFKLALACTIVLFWLWVCDFEFGQWTLITIIVVMCGQPNLGGQLQKSYARLVGTLIGGFAGCVVITFFGQSIIPLLIFTMLVLVVFSYAPGNSESSRAAGSLGGITFILIVSAKSPSLTLAMHRTVEIIFGIAIALTISKLILPIHARKRLFIEIAATLKDLKLLYTFENSSPGKKLQSPPHHLVDLHNSFLNSIINKSLHFLESIEDLPEDPTIHLDKEISEKLHLLFKLVDEAEAETTKHFNRKAYLDVIYNLHYIFLAISVLSYSLATTETKQHFEKIPILKDLNGEIEEIFDVLIDKIHYPDKESSLPEERAYLEKTEQAITEMARTISFEHAAPLHASLACIKYFIQELKKLSININRLR